jgi:uncharacterized protein (UPF0332 family)
VKPEQAAALIQYRLEQADESLREAGLLADAGAYRGAVNRAYYAMFYAALALLISRQLGASKHSQVIATFDREFVKPGLLPKSLSRSFHLAFERRQVYDYGELIRLDQETTATTIADAGQFVDAVRVHLAQGGPGRRVG